MKLSPTSEQDAAVELFGTGEHLAIEAGAGTGKTTTLRLIANSTGRIGTYVAFNTGPVKEAQRKMPKHVKARTAHSLAFAAVGYKYKARLDAGQRQRSSRIADGLGIKRLRITDSPGRDLLSKEFLAGLAMKTVTNFCHQADPEITARHVPYVIGIDIPNGDGSRGWANNRDVRQFVVPWARRAWVDLCATEGKLRFLHDHYLKQWQLSDPVIKADFILFDEAQDASPVMVDIVAAQSEAQLVWVGDSQQQIYTFTGAVNALANVPSSHRSYLTQSFRFGEPIAEVANGILEWLGAPFALRGNGKRASVAAVPKPDIILTRSNASAVAYYLGYLGEGRRPFLVGKNAASEVISFAAAADRLKAGRGTSHPELACFNTWGEVQDYVTADAQGEELRLLVNLIDNFGTDAIIAGLSGMTTEDRCDIRLATTHKAKGLEWASVKLADDFKGRTSKGELPEDEELRVLYVAVTRACRKLDVSEATLLNETDARLFAVRS